MVTTAQIAKGAGRGVLSAGIVAAHATKYGLNLGKDCVKWMCGLANELANQFAPGGSFGSKCPFYWTAEQVIYNHKDTKG